MAVVGGSSTSGSRVASSLASVEARTPSDVWAAGWQSNGRGRALLIEHWEGSQWSEVAAPRLGRIEDIAISSITADGADDAWMTGRVWYQDGHLGPALMHWDGTRWAKAVLPKAPHGVSFLDLNRLQATSPTDLWAVGAWQLGDGTPGEYAAHWNGSSWTVLRDGPFAPGADPGYVYGFSVLGS